VKPSEVTYLVIGSGALVYDMHRPGLTAADARVLAMCDVDRQRGAPPAKDLGVPFYVHYREMLEAHPEADAAVIMTPHYNHAEITLDCLEAGLHVLVEKPMALQVQDARAMVAAAEAAGRLLAVNFQQRFRPEVRTARRLLSEGKLGTLQRMSLVVSWPRSRAYYRLADWRATWRGEGGGVLMNQAPHDLDLVCHLLGLPARVFAWNRTRYHDIEVEDTISALLEWDGGASGYVHISTQESDESGQLTLVGSGGVLRLKPGAIEFDRFEKDVHDFLETAAPFDRVAARPESLVLPEGNGDHAAVHANFRSAIREEAELMCPGEEGLHSLALANGMILSSHRERPVDLPLDAEAYAGLLAGLQRDGKGF
jgi:predicted dehydrogenase